MIEVVNKYRWKGDGEVIMRGTPLGNPFKFGNEQEREMRIEQYRQWLWRQMQSDTPARRELQRLYNLWLKNGRLVLICCCAPKPCHGDIIKRALIWMSELKKS